MREAVSGRAARVAIVAALLAASHGAAGAQTAQDRYNAAQAAFDKADWPAAVAGFERVAGPLDKPPRGLAQAVIRSRLATAYLNVGRTREATALATQAIAALGSANPLELAEAYRTIGDAARFEYAPAAALDAYDHMLALAAGSPAQEDLGTTARLGIAKTTMTVSPQRAVEALDAVLASRSVTALKPRDRATFELLRGRAAMNAGDLAGARKLLDKALQDSGGLNGTKVNRDQIAIRSDGAIISQLQGDDERTHTLLTWTGAGHGDDQDWTEGADAEPPVCGEATGLRASDTAVVEFVIGDDGSVIGATPVYASRSGPESLEFARAVRGWRWTRAAVAKLDPFWRSAARVQLRCVSRPSPSRLDSDFRRAAIEWLRARGVTDADLAPLAENGEPVAHDDPRLTREDVSAIPALLGRTGAENDRAAAARLVSALDAANAPADVQALALVTQARRAAASTGSVRANARARAAALGPAIAPFERRFHASRAAAWLRLELALAIETSGSFDDAAVVLAAVLDTPPPMLAADDPIRHVATLHMAAIEKQRGDVKAADARVAATGLSADQCSLFDVRPTATNASISSTAFPIEALRWQFNGFVRESFDIAADGSVTNVRAVIAYPPFIFERATQRAVERFRYVPPTIAGKPAGCQAQNFNIRYRAPAP